MRQVAKTFTSGLSSASVDSKSTRSVRGPRSYTLTQKPTSGTADTSATDPSEQAAVSRPALPVQVAWLSVGTADGVVVTSRTGFPTRAPALAITVHVTVDAAATVSNQTAAMTHNLRPAIDPSWHGEGRRPRYVTCHDSRARRRGRCRHRPADSTQPQ
ncbi:protein of unknown function [Micropruina glycogenica]|uniref:Uncharacterized protein n=1 Tax=Micropruina glycogenica TaxID=75385 RepID=A0A2N9JEM1_9ACTN|nr:protein of unknown function [Micropruina glycogenica]